MLNLANNMGIMPGHDDLRPGRRRRLADQERHRQVPRRARGLHPDPPVDRRTRSRRCRRASPRARRPTTVDSRLPILAGPGCRRRRARCTRRAAARSELPERTGNTMATIIINGSEYPIPEGEKLNAIQMAKRVGIEIPYYCWHPALSVVANCRMCEIEVGTKDPKTGEIKMMPKLVPGCQTPAKDLTVLVTDSPKVKEHQRMIMEYLLLNHPLDCPVCDQAGECGLQDYSYPVRPGQSTGSSRSGLVNPRKDVSDLIQLNQDRCIMCTRCVRFTREITQTGELAGDAARQPRRDRRLPRRTPVDNPLAGNVVDLCPVGALLDKDFLHKQRVWFLSKHDCDLHRAARPAATSAPRRTRGSSGGSSRGPTRTSTTTGSATRAGTATRPPTTPTCSRRCTSARTTTSSRSPVDEALPARRPRAQGDRRAGRDRRGRALAVLDGRGGLPDGPLPEGAEPGQRAGAGAGARRAARTRPSGPTRPRGGPATPASWSRGRSRSTPRSAPTAGASRRSSSTSRGR